jgi:hypothetical protein
LRSTSIAVSIGSADISRMDGSRFHSAEGLPNAKPPGVSRAV